MPSDPSSRPSGLDGGTTKTASTTKPKSTAPKATANRPKPESSASASASGAAAPSPAIAGTFTDDFNRASLGADWLALSSNWQLREGKLCGQSVRNKGVWLLRSLPVNARIEFEATSDSQDGDIKAEFWGDGRTGATAASYTNATSYLTIFGGWKNSLNVLARLDEHGSDRLSVRLSPEAEAEREKPVVAGRVYAFRVERTDGKTISWSVDGQLIHKLEDKQPLSGPGHDHFGFNDWEVPVCFDNLKVTAL